MNNSSVNFLKVSMILNQHLDDKETISPAAPKPHQMYRLPQGNCSLAFHHQIFISADIFFKCF